MDSAPVSNSAKLKWPGKLLRIRPEIVDLRLKSGPPDAMLDANLMTKKWQSPVDQAQVER